MVVTAQSVVTVVIAEAGVTAETAVTVVTAETAVTAVTVVTAVIAEIVAAHFHSPRRSHSNLPPSVKCPRHLLIA